MKAQQRLGQRFLVAGQAMRAQVPAAREQGALRPGALRQQRGDRRAIGQGLGRIRPARSGGA